METKPDQCGFCGLGIKDIELLVAGPKVHICDSCVGLAAEIVEEYRKKKGIKPMKNKPYNIEDGARALAERDGWDWDATYDDNPIGGGYGEIDNQALPEKYKDGLGWYDYGRPSKENLCKQAQAVLDTLPIVFLEEGAEPQEGDIVTSPLLGDCLLSYEDFLRCEPYEKENPIVRLRKGTAVVYVPKGEA